MPPVIAAAGGAAAWYASLTAVQAAVVQLAAGAALTAAQMAFTERPSMQAQKAVLALPDALPSVRYVYGRRRVEASPITYRVRNNKLWGVWLLNSRPSVGGVAAIWIDKRRLELSGDPYDYAGDGAVATNPVWVKDSLVPEHLVRLWIGLGGQMGPPAWVLDAAPEHFLASDQLHGRTVVWMELISGGERKRAARWRNVPPRLHVEFDGCAVWDPRDPAQDPEEPESWGFSRNAALCTLDALRMNPVARYSRRLLHLESWAEKADVDDELAPLRDGGFQPRYPISALVDWSAGEVEQLIEPMLLASLGGVTRIGARLAAIPGAWQEPEVVLRRAIRGDDLVVEALQPGDQTFAAVRTTYTEPAQDWDTADAGAYEVPGAAAEDGGVPREKKVHLECCTDGVQAQRIGQALARLGRRQRRITDVFAGEAIEAVAGGTVTLDWPAPYDRLAGSYSVESMTPGLDMLGESGVAMRIPMVLRAGGPEDYAWDPATDQRDLVEGEEVPGFVPDLPMPGVITAVSGSAAALGSGGSAAPRIRFSFDPADSDRVEEYRWEYRFAGGTWADGGRIDAGVRDGAGQVFGHLHPVLVGEVYDIAVWSVGRGDESERRVYSGVVALPADVVLTPPAIAAAPGVGQVTLTITTPNGGDVQAVRVYGSGAVDPLTAVEITADPIWVGPNRTFTVAETGLGAGVTRHYWARTQGPYGALSGLSARADATTT